jgi:hypothetical protein
VGVGGLLEALNDVACFLLLDLLKLLIFDLLEHTVESVLYAILGTARQVLDNL